MHSPWGLTNPTEGERIIVTDPALDDTSEFGWHSTGSESYISTRGNNGIAQYNHDGSDEYENKPRPSDPDLKFEYEYSPDEADFASYSNASTTQLFYTANTYHDLLYLLGFTEAAGNFEVNNNGAGGQGNDFVILNAQDGQRKNNAFMLTPPDGTPGRMWMLMFNRTTPERDSAFDAGVIIHEYTHGLSTRLTGGPGNSNCLNLFESGGMGEGWSDFMATAIRLKSGDTRDTDYPLGEWISGNEAGIRAFLYSTDMNVNPYVYSNNNDFNARVHSMGTVWATMLYEVLWNLIDKHGKNDNPVPDFDSNGVPTDGKYLTLKLVIDGMALQPCNPTFVAARDAILDADQALTGGQNICEIWTAFAKRGLGKDAVYDIAARTDSFDVPDGVC
jgi:extracellular elastinolytic metalloproteinase